MLSRWDHFDTAHYFEFVFFFSILSIADLHTVREIQLWQRKSF